MASIHGFGIDRVADAAGHDPDMLRLENLDTDLPPPAEAVRATRDAERDVVLDQLDGLPVIPTGGTWSQLLDVAALGLDPAAFSAALLDHKVAATPMTGWGAEVADRHVRLVFSNEPAERLELLGERLRAALKDQGV